MRIGNGFDVHRLVEGRPLILGGVTVPFHSGLLGHSDGDALTHAIINALLGAAALGDIGTHFPPSDQRYKDANSQGLLRQVKTMLTERGYRISNVDSMIMCEHPKLSPFYAAMRETLAATLGVAVSCVSVKASTTEGLGIIGSGKGIAAQAVALLEEILA